MEWWKIALVFMSVCGMSTSAVHQLRIKPIGAQFTKSLGSSILFRCEVLGVTSEAAKTLRLRWIGRDGREISDSSGRIYVETDGPLVKKLYITAIQDQDNGTYTCSSSVNGVSETKTVNLQLFKEITFDFAPSPQHPKIDTDDPILCRVSGNPKPGVSWRYKGRRISGDDRYVLEEGALRIRNISKDDDGIYSCRAEVDADGRYDERRIAVVVYIPPKMTSVREKVESIEGQDATITCQAVGTPNPKYEFYNVDGLKMNDSNRFSVDVETGSLHFLSVKKEDEGVYTCQAVNDVGTAAEKVELKVLIAPFIYELKNTTGVEGDTASIRCLSRGEPVPVMLFFRGTDSKEISAEHNESGRLSITQSPGNVTIVIRDLSSEDAGIYTCTSTNTAGHHERNARLTINYKPRFRPDLASVVHTWSGRIQNISCHSLAHPVAFIEWLHGDHILSDNVTYRVYDVAEGISFLEVRTDGDDQGWVYGNYTCRARNQLGEAEHQIELIKATVPEPPEARVDERSPNHLVIVAMPGSDGGMRVTGYSVEYGSNVQEFKRLTTHDDSLPMPLIVNDLKSNTTYIFRIYAKNDVGSSKPTELLVTTEEVQLTEMPPAAVLASLGTNVVIGIIISIFVVFLLFVDISCYFINGCGLTMCVCVQICGRTKPKSTPNEMEEGESKEILKETPPDMEVDEAKSSQEDLEEEKLHLSEAREVDSPQVEAMEEEVVDRQQPLLEEAPQPEERRVPLNRKSILSYGDGRWKDVVHELETQLGVKKTQSDDGILDEQIQRDYDDNKQLHIERA